MTTAELPGIDVRRADERFTTRIDWLDSKHSFSFADHYDPGNTHHGLLLVNNDDVVTPGAGFDTHPHRDSEIITWVLQGALVHQDSMGHSGVIYPGLAQRMSAGTGILHSERNDSWRVREPAGATRDLPVEPVRFIQMWLVPDESGIAPSYEQLEVHDELDGGGLVTIASGMPTHADHSAIRIANRHAAMHVARMRAGQAPIILPDSPFAHLFVADGEVDMEGVGRLHTGDAVRLTDVGGPRLSTDVGAEVIVWEMHAGLGPPR
ncbi:pirin-like bicupin family protein [Williamsia sp. CHRR-6]|uniref:pirin family protein n=1 Tax=Williamsia sp. CHRR-6 TaxID=2835871 RepID=UPI001BDA1A7F|nr:pirin-like bicupin family protein [Williamsia sp. CHRR-6]MBT0567116.1 pirin family protein [Williamsia sp. CHRR-6]